MIPNGAIPVRFWLALAGLMIVVITGVLLAVNRLTQTSVTLDIGGHVQQLETRAETVQDVLDEADVLIDPEDVIWPAPQTPLKNGMTITVHKAYAVAVEADETVSQVRTQATHPLEILSGQGIGVEPYDTVRVDGKDFSPERLEKQSWNTPPTSIQVVRSATLKVIDQDRTMMLHTTQVDVGRALDGAGIKLYLADMITPNLSTPVQNGLTITIQRSVPVTIRVDDRQFDTRAIGPTVGDALANAGIGLVEQDYALPSVDTTLEAGMVIDVVRVIEKELVEPAVMPFNTVYVPSSSLPFGETRMLQEGLEGKAELVVRMRYENGQVVSQSSESSTIVQSPTPCLIFYGVY